MRARATAGFWIATVLLGVLALLGVLGLTGCGEKHNPARTGEREHDIEVLNVAIGQEMALVEAYEHAAATVADPRNRAILRHYVAQEQEHLDGWTKALRGLGGELTAEAEELDYSGLHDERDRLRFAYDQTSVHLTHFLEDVTQLATPAPRSFAASIAANEAQHLVVIRQMLGADLLEAVPDSFDTGEVPPPEEEVAPRLDGKE